MRDKREKHENHKCGKTSRSMMKESEKKKEGHAEVRSLGQAISGRVLVSYRIKRVRPIEFARSIVMALPELFE